MDHRKPIRSEGLSENERRAGPKTTRNPEAQHDDATEIRELTLLQTSNKFWLKSKFRDLSVFKAEPWFLWQGINIAGSKLKTYEKN